MTAKLIGTSALKRAGHIIAQPGMKKLLNDMGILGAINQAWKMTVDRKSVDLEFLMSRWSTKRHSFVTAWGEFRSSLKDVAMLTYLLMFGKAHALGFYPDVENKKRIQALKTSLSKSKYSNKATYLSWGEEL